ncbi:hypothetical protein Q0Z83_016200 [Actinoplanes sichuanensis]|uniref:Uncharacterized protein n=1 Tax=Actinoplanes sichuanensis TaxID=512349 RepID=A0ABW4A8D5_9ACTN|nr:hypothetical protein [Actinoplanes sichuanensis]BEL03429.1 hypothetical protein Q0Z83_016200 [Actinoplanes sichuanensis]
MERDAARKPVAAAGFVILGVVLIALVVGLWSALSAVGRDALMIGAVAVLSGGILVGLRRRRSGRWAGEHARPQ